MNQLNKGKTLVLNYLYTGYSLFMTLGEKIYSRNSLDCRFSSPAGIHCCGERGPAPAPGSPQSVPRLETRRPRLPESQQRWKPWTTAFCKTSGDLMVINGELMVINGEKETSGWFEPPHLECSAEFGRWLSAAGCAAVVLTGIDQLMTGTEHDRTW